MLLNHQEIVKRILSETAGGVDFIVLFGSKARGDATPRSDIDIAVSIPTATPAERLEAKLRLIGGLAGPGSDFDVIVVEEAGWSLRFRIARDGVVLYEREKGLWEKFVENVIIYYPDWRIFEERFLQDFLEGE